MREIVWKLRDWVEESNNIVVFVGGAVSSESDLDGFRSDEGIRSSSDKYGILYEQLLNIDTLTNNPVEFFNYYREKILLPSIHAIPGQAHNAISDLEDMGKLGGVITTNIDALHQAAGTIKVLELNGSYRDNYCIGCEKIFSYHDVMGISDTVPACDVCGGIIRPKIALYGEDISPTRLKAARVMINRADMFIVAGTSLVVYPVASLLQYHKGEHLALIHTDTSAYDRIANLVIEGSIGKVLWDVVKNLRNEIRE